MWTTDLSKQHLFHLSGFCCLCHCSLGEDYDKTKNSGILPEALDGLCGASHRAHFSAPRSGEGLSGHFSLPKLPTTLAPTNPRITPCNSLHIPSSSTLNDDIQGAKKRKRDAHEDSQAQKECKAQVARYQKVLSQLIPCEVPCVPHLLARHSDSKLNTCQLRGNSVGQLQHVWHILCKCFWKI